MNKNSFLRLPSFNCLPRWGVFLLDLLLCIVAYWISLWIINSLYFMHSGQKLPINTALYLFAFLAFVLLFCLRAGVKLAYESLYQKSHTTPKVLIFGVKSTGPAIAKMLRSAGNSPYHPVGFIEEKDITKNYRLDGLPVFGLNGDLFEWMHQHNVQHIIVSPDLLKEINPATDLNLFLEHNIHVLTTPYFTEFDQEPDPQKIGSINSIRIEDLLQRPAIRINTDNVRHILHNKVVMVTGAAGSIGTELVHQIVKYAPKAVILFEQAESPLHDLLMDLHTAFPKQSFVPIVGDVRECSRVEEVFKEYRPDIVYHAAAYKHVPLMENHPNEAVRANILGTKNMADMAVKYAAERFIMISTDKAVNPTNIMGASKRIAEIYVQSLFKHIVSDRPDCTKFITTRFGNVLGSNGSVIPFFKKQIAKGGPVTVTHPDITRYFMTIPEACCLVMEASTLGKGGEIFVFDMGQAVKILDLAKNMIRLAGYTPGEDIPIVFTGLRPGEKLYEELLNQKETTMPTTHSKILIARVREFPFEQISQQIDHLITTSRQNKPFITVQEMKAIVPEYISKNSIYEQLDS